LETQKKQNNKKKDAKTPQRNIFAYEADAAHNHDSQDGQDYDHDAFLGMSSLYLYKNVCRSDILSTSFGSFGTQGALYRK
jgi:hypothetical protein